MMRNIHKIHRLESHPSLPQSVLFVSRRALRSFSAPCLKNVKEQEEEVSSGTAKPCLKNVKEQQQEEEVSSETAKPCPADIPFNSLSDSSDLSDEWTSSDDDETPSKNADDQVDIAHKEMDIIDEDVTSYPDFGLHLEPGSIVKRSCEEFQHKSYGELVRGFLSRKPSSWSPWKDLWETKSVPVWVNVYGYYDKKNGYGGYGVILRNDSAHPIIAATSFTKGGQVGERSKLLQIFKGLKTSLELAANIVAQYPRHFLRLRVLCNVKRAIHVLGSQTFKDAGACKSLPGRHEDMTNGVCRVCTKSYADINDTTFEALIPFFQKLKVSQAKLKGDFHFQQIDRYDNKAAHLLAMNAKKMDAKKGCKDFKIVKPDDFPPELNDILFKDAFDIEGRYSQLSLRGCF